jgi:hypothetical protein
MEESNQENTKIGNACGVVSVKFTAALSGALARQR